MKFRLLRKGTPAISEVSTLRLYLLRAMYLYMFVGLAIFKWPGILNPPPGLSNEGSVVGSVLGAFSLLALLGIRYPVKMLPLLFIELVWKSMWFLGWGLPLALSDQLSPADLETLTGCLMGIVLVPLVTPWGYVFKHYVKSPGDRWGKQVKVTASSPKQPSSSAYEATTISRP
jgi:hypothetical protein